MPDMLVCDVHKARQGLVNDTSTSAPRFDCTVDAQLPEPVNAKHNACTSFPRHVVVPSIWRLRRTWDWKCGVEEKRSTRRLALDTSSSFSYPHPAVSD
jgi:hypothetical protein